MVYVPYVLMLIITGVCLRLGRIAPFSRRFGMAFATFGLAALVFYAFIAFVDTEAWHIVPLLGHAWRLALVLGVTSLLSAAVAQVTAPRV